MHNREPSSNPSFPRFQERLWPAGKKEKAREQREIEEEEESGKVVTAESPSPPPSIFKRRRRSVAASRVGKKGREETGKEEGI